MRIQDVFRLVITNLSRRKGRTILTTIGVIIGTAAIVTMMALGIGMQKSLTSQFESMGSAKDITVMPQVKMNSTSVFSTGTDASDILNNDVVEEIKKIKNVEAVIPTFSLYADTELKVGKYVASMSIVGYDPRENTGAKEKMAEGKFLGKENGLVMVVGYKVPEVFKDTRNQRSREKGVTAVSNMEQPQDADHEEQRIDVLHKTAKLTISRTGVDGKKEYKTLRIKIIGVIEEKGSSEDYSIFMPMEEVARLNDWVKNQSNTLKKQGYDTLKVQVASTEDVDEVVQKISDLGYTALSLKQILEQLNQSFIVIQGILGGIGAIALLVASIGIINTMTMAIYERTKEIGIMKVVGASIKDIRNIFIIEAGMIGFFGGAIGIIISYLISMLINFFMGIYIASASGSTQSESMLVMPAWLMIFAVAFSTLIGLAAGLYPAMKAAKLSALHAIRTE